MEFLDKLISHVNENKNIFVLQHVPQSLFFNMRMRRQYVEYLMMYTNNSLYNVPPSLLPGQIRGESEYFVWITKNHVIMFAVTYKGIIELPPSWIHHWLSTVNRLPRA